jgi:hypothetical protein
MDWGKMIQKGLLGGLTFVTAYLAANPDAIVHLIPKNISDMTVGGVVGFVIVAVTNWLKNRTAVK